ncbi:unnamed protein product, partial [Ectocarpus fasciculatus]
VRRDCTAEEFWQQVSGCVLRSRRDGAVLPQEHALRERGLQPRRREADRFRRGEHRRQGVAAAVAEGAEPAGDARRGPQAEASERPVQLCPVHGGALPQPRRLLQVGHRGTAHGRGEGGGEGARGRQALGACRREHGSASAVHHQRRVRVCSLFRRWKRRRTG